MIDQLAISIIGRNEIDCQGLKRILETGGYTVDQCVRESPLVSFENWRDDEHHLIIIDSGSEQAALDHCSRIRAHMPSARMLLLDDQCEIETVRQAFATGVDGVVARNIGSEPLLSSLELLALGEKIFPSQLVDALTSGFGIPAPASPKSRIAITDLSEREIEILRCLAAGQSNKIIGRKLSVSEATVKAHVKTILRKLQLGNRTQAAIWAISRGLDHEDEKPTPRSKAPGAGSKDVTSVPGKSA